MNLPPLLLVHGYPFDHTMWDHTVGLLDPAIQVLTPDLRGFGGCPLGPDQPSLDRMAEDLAIFLRERNIGRAVVAGMSMGGYVALAFAEHDKEQLAGLALIGSQTASDSDEARANRRAMIAKIKKEGPAAAANAAIPKMFAPQNSQRPELIRFPMLGAEKAGVDGLAWALEAMARRPDRTAVLQALKAPLLIIHGAHDQFIPIARARDLARSAANADYVELLEAGHATPLEAPAKVADALNQFVKKCAAT